MKKIFLCSEIKINGQNSDDQTEDVSDDFILADTNCAVVLDESSPESVWFIKVKDSFESAVKIIKGRFLEKVDVPAKGFLRKLFKKKHSFLRTVPHPHVFWACCFIEVKDWIV